MDDVTTEHRGAVPHDSAAVANRFREAGEQRCASVAQTQALAEAMGACLHAGEVVVLSGPLGAGKTTFTQGLARGMGVLGRVTSPTFVIAREHASASDGPALVHVDAYRLLEGSEDPLDALDALDLDTELEDAVVVAEWGEGLIERLSGSCLLVEVDRTSEVERDPASEARWIRWRWA